MAEETVTPKPHLSKAVTWLCGAVVAVTWVIFAVESHFVSRIEALESPVRSLVLISSRTLDLEDVIPSLPPFERWLHSGGQTRGEVLNDLRQWHEELSEEFPGAVADFSLAVIEAEAGATEAVRRKVKEWAGKDKHPYPVMSRTLACVFLGAGPFTPEISELLQYFEGTWFYDRIMIPGLRKTGKGADAEKLEAAKRERTLRFLNACRILFILDLFLLFGGLAAFALTAVRREWKLADAVLPPPWSLGDGCAVLIRSAAVGILLCIPLVLAGTWLGASNAQMTLMMELCFFLPVLVFARWHLFQPFGTDLKRALGFTEVRSAAAVIGMVFAGWGLLNAADWVWNLTADQFRLGSHWAESFDSDLVWGGFDEAALNIVVAVILAPFYEEIFFRGLFYGSLRTRFGFAASALLSTFFFSVIHAYGALGFFSTFLSGLAWCWLYEKTRSLWPNVLIHATYNLIASGAIAMLRLP